MSYRKKDSFIFWDGLSLCGVRPDGLSLCGAAALAFLAPLLGRPRPHPGLDAGLPGRPWLLLRGTPAGGAESGDRAGPGRGRDLR